MTYRFRVSVQYDLVDGLTPVFTHQDGANPFDIGEWPEVRSELREQVEKDIPSDFEVYLHSDRTGERFEYTVGEIVVSSSGKLEEKRYDMSVDSLQEAFKEV